MSFTPDNLFEAEYTPVDFQFDEKTAAVFPDMIHRSIPGYATLLKLLGVMSAQFVKEGDSVYDLGCSLGGATLALQKLLPKSVTIHAVDLSPAMISRLQDYVAGAALSNIEVVQADIFELALKPNRLVVLNFVLQFLTPSKREEMIQKIYDSLQDGGALLIAEKTRPINLHVQSWYEGFKKVQGYSELAISRKRESLEEVMRTDTEYESVARLQKAGFQKITPIFQGMMFKAWVAEK